MDEFHWVKSKGGVPVKKTICMLLVALLMLLCGTALAANDEVHRCYSFSYAYDDEYHWEVCDHCGAIGRKGKHVLSCAENGTCEYCGATGVSGKADHYWTGAWAGDEQCCWMICGGCGAESEHTPHVSRCNQRNPGFCMNCGLPCEIGHVYWDTVSLIRGNCVTSTIEKLRCRDCGEEQTVEWEFTGKCWYDYVNEGDVHTFMCTGCNTIRYSEGHSRSCMGGTSCLFCGAEGITGGISHEEYELVNQGDTHAYVCTACGAIDWSEEHSVPCTGGTTCVDCGAEGVTGEFSHEAADGWHYDNEKCWLNCANCDAHAFENPHWNYCNAMDACINCDATNVTLVAVHNTSEISAMDYGLVSCWYLCDTCGEACYHMPHLFEEGGACSVCGFAGIATVPVEATVEGENLSADVTLLVEQPQEDVSALLPEAVRTSVQQVYIVKLLEKGEAIEPNGSIKVAIQLEEGADLTGKKLMRLQEDDTLAEIAYEVVEGKLTFVTKAVGTFVLVDATAE